MAATTSLEGALSAVIDALAASEPFERLLLERERPIRARAEAGEGAAVAALARSLDAPVLAVSPGPREADALAEEVGAYLGDTRTALLPAWEALPYEGISPSPEVAARRADAIGALRRATGAFVVVAPVLAAMQAVIPTLGTTPPLDLVAGRDLPPDDLAERLEELGYRRVDVVEHRGEFAVRGGVVDVFPGTARRPVRVDYWGDEIESLRAFTPSTQLSTDRLGHAAVGPVRELIPDADVRARAGGLAPAHVERFRDGLQRIADGLRPEGMETFAPLLFDAMPTPAELLPEGSWVVVTREARTRDRSEQAHAEAEALADALSWPGTRPLRNLDDAIGDRVRLHLTEFTEGIDLSLRGWGSAVGKPSELVARLTSFAERGFRVVVTGRAHGSLERVREVVGDLAVETAETPLPSGFVSGPARVAVVTEEDLFGSRRHTRTAPRFTKRRTDAVAEELEPGDHAVHRIHGVARYAGIVHRELAGSERDYLVLEYAAGDKLFVPSDQVGMVARYVGGDAPRIHRMGGSDWARATAKVKRAVKDMAGELVRLYTVRMSVPGHAFGPDTPWQQELEDAFPHEETPDQLRVIDEVKADMEQRAPMDRLLLGDVGFGKTEIALRAAFKAVQDGKQVAVLVPTTILAEQHFLTFTERFAPFPVTVRMLSRFVSPEEQRKVVADIAAGKVDVVIGTHRLLSKDLKFRDLGLLVVDEEQRFGVSHKERLKAMRAHVDVLTMTATPIPRTLEMALTGIRQMSTIDTPPEDRQPVLTYVGSYDEDLALGAVRRELLREGQVFWVHNRIATIDRQAGWLRQQLPDARIVVAHGQMEEDQLEHQMMRFWEREADVLVCTTIIESGLDVPSANTLIVDRADMLGLAQLYQLRGRVGRSSERAFAYFFFPAQREMTEEAHARLATIAKHQDLGSGFHIALRDLEIRGAGNLLGAEQSGHIASVGFDAYARILQESVRELQGEEIEPEQELRIDLPVKAFVPPGWVAQEALRLELYRRISLAPDHDALAEIRAETVDRYGGLPPQVETLFAIASLRITAARLGVREVGTFKKEVRLTPVPIPATLQLDMAERIPGATFHATKATLNLTPDRVFGADLVRWTEARLRAAVGEPDEPGLAGTPSDATPVH
ncbi:MAG TPA: transcription-repair coupling factor [Actinomycetota bacterium]|nr:transcription-repair coupling factor [Actinomycetota bacterium]